MLRGDFRCEVDLTEPTAGEYGRIDQLLERDGLETGGRGVGLKGGAKLPASGKGDGGRDEDVGDVRVRDVAVERIDKDGVPAKER